MYTATLDLDRAWILDPTDPTGNRVVCGTRTATAATSARDGEVRHYAGNRVMGEVRDQDDRVVPVTLAHVSPTERDLLETWRGRVLLVRMTSGQRFFAVYFQIQDLPRLRTTPEDSSDNLTYDVDVTFIKVSYNEAV